jgi:hypothetical protein
MKAKISRGSGFRGALSYLFDEGPKAAGNKNAEVVGGNMAGRTSWELSREFGVTRALRPDVKKPVWHASLSLPAGEVLTPEGWDDVSCAFLKEMGFTERIPYTVIRHSDTNYDHVHILLSRIDLDAKLWHGQWEARRAIEATQQLEKDFGLRLTPGLGSARAERKKLTDKEINKAVRTGEAAPKQVIQEAIDSLLDGRQITALEFSEGLEMADIGVRANVASTGRMNGFSFEYGGIHFKASQLGKAYSWKNLQQRGVTYEQDRDSTGLERFRAQQSANPTDSGTATADGGEQGPDRGAAASDSGPSERGIGSPGGLESGQDRAVGSNPEDDPRYDVERADETGDQELRDIDEAITDDDQPDQPAVEGSHLESRSGGDFIGSRPTDGTAGEGNAAALVEGASTGGVQRANERPSGGGIDWAFRFKTASSAKRGRPTPSTSDRKDNGSGVRADPRDLQSARTIDPTPYLESHGFRVRWEGKHGSVRDERGDEHYRLTRRADGRTLWCDLYGNDGGDSIALVRELEPDTPFVDAVYRLLGGGTGSTTPSTPQQRQTPLPKQYPKMTLGGADAVAAGRAYLRDKRLINDDSIRYAEDSKMLRYDRDGRLLFAGYDAEGRARNVTRRAINSRETVQKCDIKGSDKSFPPILPGDNGAPVWIVEGGVDAIALHAEARAKGKTIPNIIVSGGSGVRSFLENWQVQQLLRDAPKVTIACDNEKDTETQARTDAQHAAQRDAVALFNREVSLWHPPVSYGDVADLRVANEIRRREAAEERAAEARLAATEARLTKMQSWKPAEEEKIEKNPNSVAMEKSDSIRWKEQKGPEGAGM